MAKQMIAIGNEGRIYTYEKQTNGQLANFEEATDEEAAEFRAEQAKADKAKS